MRGLAAFHDHIGVNLSAQNAVSDVLGPGRLSRTESVAIDIVWGPNCTAGTVVIETAHDPKYTGTWAVIQTLAWSAGGKVDHWDDGDEVYACLRVRISVAIENGSINAHAMGK